MRQLHVEVSEYAMELRTRRRMSLLPQTLKDVASANAA